MVDCPMVHGEPSRRSTHSKIYLTAEKKQIILTFSILAAKSLTL
jgi:hypothetical protein